MAERTVPPISASHPRLPRNASDLYAVIDWDISPQCQYCAHYEPGDGRHCLAYPEALRTEIPDAVYCGRLLHITPFGNEQRDEEGQLIVFVPHVETERTPENARLLNAYEAYRHDG